MITLLKTVALFSSLPLDKMSEAAGTVSASTLLERSPLRVTTPEKWVSLRPVLEILGNDPYTLHTTAHGAGYSGAGGKTAAFNKGVNFADGYHTYTTEWNSDFIAWRVDGQEVHRLTSGEVPQWDFNQQFFILLNLAVGGNWPGDPNGSTPFPQSMAVDWVRTYYWA